MLETGSSSRASAPGAVAWAVSQSLVIAVLLLVPLPDTGAPPGSDKLVHVILFAWLGACWAWTPPGRRRPLVALSGVLVFGITLEGLQAFVPWRSMEPADILADGLGAVAGMLLVASARRILGTRT